MDILCKQIILKLILTNITRKKIYILNLANMEWILQHLAFDIAVQLAQSQCNFMQVYILRTPLAIIL